MPWPIQRVLVKAAPSATGRVPSSPSIRYMRVKRLGVIAWCTALLAFGQSLALQSPALQSPALQSPAPPAAEAKPAEKTYVGSETCQACHEDFFNAIKKSPH